MGEDASGREVCVFGDACDELRQWMVPIVVATKRTGKAPTAGVGAGLILNEDGWVLTAGHIVAQINDLYKANASGSKSKKKPGDLEGFHVYWGRSPAKATKAIVQQHSDLGLCKLKDYSPDPGYTQPRFRSDDEVRQGELLCRAGYPLVGKLNVAWNARKKEFTLTDVFPVTVFVNEGVVSRFVGLNVKGTQYQFIETSSPGLKGQSGGPLVDSGGRVCGIQVRTTHYPLGFTPQVGDRKEHQFLNAGQAVHVATVRAFLDKHEIDYGS